MTLTEYLAWFDEVVGPTERMMRMVPPDRLDWKLTDKSFTLGQLLAHISRSLWFNAQVFKGGELPAKNIREILVGNRRQVSATVEEAVSQLASNSALFKETVAGLGEERFQRELIDSPQRGRVPAWRLAAFTLEHHIHHLMELHLCLKVLGIKVHTGTLYSSSESPS
jgi:uncharacterized damage-inducible protein DinB